MNNGSEKRRTVIGLVIIAGLVMGWFSPWWIDGRVLAPLDVLNQMMEPWRAGSEHIEVKNHMVSDSVNQYLGYHLFAEHQLRSEGRIGWSSLTYGGTAAYANTMALYDNWTMQLHRWFDFWTAWHLGLMVEVFVAGCGMFLFLRGRGIGLPWAVAGGLAFAANSQFVMWVHHRWSLGSFCWVPLIFLAMDRAREGSRVAGFLVPFVIALSFLGGTLQHSVLVAVAVAIFALASGSSQGGRWRHVGQVSVWGGVAAGLVAFMLVPCVDGFLTTLRLGTHHGMTTGADESVYRYGVAQPLFQLASYPLHVFPSLFGGCDSVDLLKLFKSELFYVAYFGALPCLVAVCSLRSDKVPAVAKWLVIAGLVLPLTPLERYLYQRLLVLYILGGVIAFAYFMEGCRAESRRRWSRSGFCVFGLFAGCWVVASSVVFWFGGEWITEAKEAILARSTGSSFGYFRDWWIGRVDRFVDRLFVWNPWQLVPLATLGGALLGFWWTGATSARRRHIGAWVIVVCVVTEVSVFGSRWVTWSELADSPLYAETPAHRELAMRLEGGSRIKNLSASVGHMARTPMMANTLVPYQLPTLDGYDSIVPEGMSLPGDPDVDPVRNARMGVSHLITPAEVSNVAGWEMVWADQATAIHENPVKVSRYSGFSDGGSLKNYLRDCGAVPPVPLKESLGEENRRRLLVPPMVEWVRLAENYGDGWKWRFPGQAWQAVDRMADGSMGFDVGAGKLGPREVVMEYQPPLRAVGWLVSGCTVIIWLACLLFSTFNRKLRHGDH